MKKGVEIDGQMEPKWISQIGRDPGIADHVNDIATTYKMKLEAKMKGRFGDQNRHGYHYGRVNLGRGWTQVAIIFPITPAAKANLDAMDQPEGTESR